MAYKSENLSVGHSANGLTLWRYVTTDDYATVDTAGYFNAADKLRSGDTILVTAKTAATPKSGLFLVGRAAPGGVAVYDTTPLVVLGRALSVSVRHD